MFQTKYPAFYALLALFGASVQDAETPGESALQKLEGSIALVPQILAFIPQAGSLGAEVAVLKTIPADIEAGAELLVTELAFSSTKAKAVIAAAFPLAESAVSLVPQVEALVEAIQS